MSPRALPVEYSITMPDESEAPIVSVSSTSTTSEIVAPALQPVSAAALKAMGRTIERFVARNPRVRGLYGVHGRSLGRLRES